MIEFAEVRTGLLLVVAAGAAGNRRAFRVRVDEVEAVAGGRIRFTATKVTPAGDVVIEWSLGERVPAERIITAGPGELTPFTPGER